MGKRQTVFALAGMTFTWPLLRTSSTGALLLAASEAIPWALDCYCLFVIAGLLLALAGVAFAPSLQRLFLDTPLVLAAGALSLASNGVVALSLGLQELHPLVLVLGTLGFALSVPVLIVGWALAVTCGMARCYQRCALCLCVSFSASFVLSAVQYLPFPTGLMLPLVCPLASALLFMKAFPSEDPGTARPLPRNTERLLAALKRLPWATLALFVVTMLLGCMFMAIFRSNSMGPRDVGLGMARDATTAVLAAFIALIVMRLRKGPRTFRTIWVVIFSMLCLGPLIVMVSRDALCATFGIALASAPRACLSFFLFFYLSFTTAERGLPATLTFSAVFLPSNALSDALSFAFAPMLSSALSADYAALLQPIAFVVSAVTFVLFIGFSGKMALEMPSCDGSGAVTGGVASGSCGEIASRLFVEAGITERESEVIRLIAEGNSYKATAQQLHITEGTVQSHIKRIYGKLNVHSRQELIDLLHSQKSGDTASER